MIFTVIGARPQFVKAAVLSAALQQQGIPEYIIHTGQHYDHKMSGVFFEELMLPGAAINLNIGSGPHGMQTAEMLTGIEKILIEKRAEVSAVLLYGDTNSTLAGALAASKLSIPIIHVEAGLRSYNRDMPEELNRVLTDHLSALLFCSSDQGEKQLAAEGITEGVHIVGDIMLDAFDRYGAIVESKCKLGDVIPGKINENYILLTIHRPVNTDDPAKLQEILAALGELDADIVWPIHPRNRVTLGALNIPGNLHLFEPFSYFEMMLVLSGAKKVITDSGGLQKEAYWAKKPCITIRTETEWVETLENQWNILAGTDQQSIKTAVLTKIDAESWKPLYGDGHSAERMASFIGQL